MGTLSDMYKNVHNSMILRSQEPEKKKKTPKCSLNTEYINKFWCIYTIYNSVYK